MKYKELLKKLVFKEMILFIQLTHYQNHSNYILMNINSLN